MTIIFLAALLTCGGAISDRTPGWTFEASKAKGGVYFNEFEGYYPDKGGKLISKRVKVEGNRYYRLLFDAKAKERGYEAVNFYNAEGNWIADNYDVVYEGERQHYDRVVFAMPGTDSLEVFFQSKSGLEAWDVTVEEATIADAAEFCDRTYAKIPQLAFKPEGNPLRLAPKTLDALKTGRPWRMLLLGDSIVQDTYHSQFPALVQRLYPKANVTWLVSVRGSTGCWYYQDEMHFADYVTRYHPDCVMIGGISNWIHPEMTLNGGPAIEAVANRIVDELKAEVVIMTPTLSYDLRDPASKAVWDRPNKVCFSERELKELADICAKNNWPFWDLYTPAYDWLKTCERPINFYSRDQVHSGELGKQLIARLMEVYFEAAQADGSGTQVLAMNKATGPLERIESLPVACSVRETVAGETPSLLPDGKNFKLVWHDEFTGTALDDSKWSYRTNFWGNRAHWFATPEDGCVSVKDGFVRLKIKKLANGQFVSPQLQTGELMWDVPHQTNLSGFWPLVKREKPKFVHKYGYYECRCRLQKKVGWWSAFWMQAEQQGCTLDPAISGIEHDIMESFDPGEVIVSAFHHNGYGPDYKGFHIPASYDDEPVYEGKLNLAVDTENFHTFGLLWEPDGYSVYVDGRLRGRNNKAVSHIPEFILLSTECKWYRNNRMTGEGVPELEAAADAGDEFVVDWVRVYDVVK